MILRRDITSVGEFFKPHGIKGELSASLDAGLSPADLRCIILDIDGIFVPFFIKEFRSRGNGWLIKIDGIETDTAAAALARHEIYALTAELPDVPETDEDGVNLYDLEGYTLVDGDTPIGVIEHIDDSTANILLHVTTPDGATVYVPFALDFVVGLDTEEQVIDMNLPEGILDLN